MKNFIQPGKNINFVAPEKILGGSLITQGSLVGVAVTDSDSAFTDDLIALATEGVATLNKGAGALTQGQKVMVPTAAFSNNVDVVADDGNGIYVGIVTVAAGAGDATVAVKLNA